MNKIIKVLCVILVGSLINLSIIANSENKNLRHAKLNYEPLTLEMHVKDSNLIVVADVAEVVEQINMDGASFKISKIKIDKSIKGSVTKGEEILLLQTDCVEDPIVKKNEKVLLFLEKYNGKISSYDNTYVCKGLYQGQYKIDQGIVKNSLNNNSVKIKYNKSADVNLFIQEITNIVNKTGNIN